MYGADARSNLIYMDYEVELDVKYTFKLLPFFIISFKILVYKSVSHKTKQNTKKKYFQFQQILSNAYSLIAEILIEFFFYFL